MGMLLIPVVIFVTGILVSMTCGGLGAQRIEESNK